MPCGAGVRTAQNQHEVRLGVRVFRHVGGGYGGVQFCYAEGADTKGTHGCTVMATHHDRRRRPHMRRVNARHMDVYRRCRNAHNAAIGAGSSQPGIAASASVLTHMRYRDSAAIWRCSPLAKAKCSTVCGRQRLSGTPFGVG